MFIVEDTIKQALQQINNNIFIAYCRRHNQTGSITVGDTIKQALKQINNGRTVFIVGDTIKQALQQINNNIFIAERCLL